MSDAVTSQNPDTTKATTDDSAHSHHRLQQTQVQEKKARLEEDDEFEDFPVEEWNDDQTDLANGGEGSAYLWEESWDDDETNDDFAKMLKEELRRVGETQPNGKN